MKKYLFCISMIFAMTGLIIAQTSLNENITCKQAMKLVQEYHQDVNFIILDIRTPDEYNSGHIEKAILIDYKSEDFQDKIGKLDKSKKYLVYCQGGVRSKGAIEILKDQNFKNLYHLYEGFKMWKAEGYKTVMNHKRPDE